MFEHVPIGPNTFCRVPIFMALVNKTGQNQIQKMFNCNFFLTFFPQQICLLVTVFPQSLAGLRSAHHQPLLPQDPYLSLPLAPPASANMSRRPSSVTLANLGLASPSHAPTTRPGSAMTLGDSSQPLVVMRKQDLDDFCA